MTVQWKKLILKIQNKFNIGHRPSQPGQSIIILTFAFLGLIAMLGLALDMGLVYVNRVRLKRAVDAATLASVVELPSEEDAVKRAIDFLFQNGYTDANVYVAGCVRDIHNDFGNGPNSLRNMPLTADFRNDLLNNGIGGANVAGALETISNDPTLFYHYVRSPNPNAPNFYIDTRSYQIRTFDEAGNNVNAHHQCNPEADPFADVGDGGPYGSASKLRIFAEIPVRMNFMQFLSFETVDVLDEAVAQNASNLDVAVVLDRTGSMRFDTICWGCWKECDGSAETGCSANDRYKDYPTNGVGFPVNWTDVRTDVICADDDADCTISPLDPGEPKPETGNNYIILEAELYSKNTSIWDPAFRSLGQGYWALQRTYDADMGAYSVDGRDASVRHHPYLAFSDTGVPFGKNYSLAEAQNGDAPRLEYDFTPTWTGNTYIYLRATSYTHSSSTNNGHAQTPTPVRDVHWAVSTFGTAPASGDISTDSQVNAIRDSNFQNNNWQWIKIGTKALTQNQKYTLNLYAGSPGYAIDRIVIAGTNSYDTVGKIGAISGGVATPGSAQRFAADICNPIYGESVLATDCRPDGYVLPAASVNNLNDPLFSDLQPMRGAQEAVKAFVERLDPSLDQAGFIYFNTTAFQSAQLECLQAARSRQNAGAAIANYPLNATILGEFDETECSDPDLTAAGQDPIEFQNVVIGIEDIYPTNGTDIADGLRRGLHMLGVNTDDDDGGNHANDCNWTTNGSDWFIGGSTQPDTNTTSHCSRGAAATQVIVLLTDGAPTDNTPGDTGESNSECNDNSINPLPYPDFPDGNSKYRCIMYYAQIAGNNGIIVYTIGLGAGADPDLLGAVADETNGQYYFAPSTAQLNIIFNQILANIYVRIVQ